MGYKYVRSSWEIKFILQQALLQSVQILLQALGRGSNPVSLIGQFETKYCRFLQSKLFDRDTKVADLIVFLIEAVVLWREGEII